MVNRRQNGICRLIVHLALWFLSVPDTKQIKKGKGTPAFQRADAAGADESLCLSIVTDARTLDLQAVSEEVRNRWLSALHETLLFVHMNAPRDVRGDALIKMHDALSAAELQAARAEDEARKQAERDQRQSRVDAMKQKYAR
jgi:hypothetical protein